ncbi:hypothetical protein Rt10032_c02g0651 [Rhodotorula toruloides]|uniref:Uncharacterized protein n=1 Tax=Rhodotorula toruloides TaxID=5286 RepID=A0A511KB30_RHOTO|nr:hypothetical protein Rt10032_c02g0651 [Rhodotorula toruloides]
MDDVGQVVKLCDACLREGIQCTTTARQTTIRTSHAWNRLIRRLMLRIVAAAASRFLRPSKPSEASRDAVADQALQLAVRLADSQGLWRTTSNANSVALLLLWQSMANGELGSSAAQPYLVAAAIQVKAMRDLDRPELDDDSTTWAVALTDAVVALETSSASILYVCSFASRSSYLCRDADVRRQPASAKRHRPADVAVLPARCSEEYCSPYSSPAVTSVLEKIELEVESLHRVVDAPLPFGDDPNAPAVPLAQVAAWTFNRTHNMLMPSRQGSDSPPSQLPPHLPSPQLASPLESDILAPPFTSSTNSLSHVGLEAPMWTFQPAHVFNGRLNPVSTPPSPAAHPLTFPNTFEMYDSPPPYPPAEQASSFSQFSH